MIDHNGSWLPSVTWGVPFFAVLALILLGVFVISLLAGWKDAYGLSEWGFGGGVAGIVLAAIVVSTSFGYWPWKADYHKLQPVSGTVKAVDSRFLAASQYVVVTYDTGLVVRCDDSRCATVRPGETLRLLCTKEHQFGSPLATDGWSCRWGQV